MSEASGEIRWVALESNPDVMTKYMHKLGMSKKWYFTDVFGLTDDLLAMVPQPAIALLLLFPYHDKYKEFAREQEAKIDQDGQTVSDQVFFMKQTIRNACGTIGLLHAVLNCRDQVPQESHLKNFYDKTHNLTPAERGKTLEEDEEISKAHGDSAQEGQTEAPSAEESVCPHFIAFVPIDNSVYELDGCKKFPINHGEIQDSNFLKSAAKVCQQFMERDPTDLRFTILALTNDES